MKWSNITLLREISEVCVRKTVFQTTKATQVYCSWQVMVCYRYTVVEFNVPLDTVGLYVISEPGEFHTLTTVSAKKSIASAVVTVCFIRFIRMSSSLTNIDRTLVYVFMKQRSLGCNWRRTYTGKVLIAVSRSRAEPARGWVMNETSHSHSHNLRNLFTHLLISRPRRMEGWVGLGEK